jgi:hypothetical protein
MLVITSCSLCAQNWTSLGHGFNYSTSYLFADSIQDKLYIAGRFAETYNDTTLTGICYFKNGNYVNMGCGVDWNCTSIINNMQVANVNQIIKYNNEIIISGAFQMADGKPIKYLAKWNGLLWDSIGICPDAAVTTMYVNTNNELIVAGYFSNIGGINSFGIAKWNGTFWSAFNTPLPWTDATSGIITTMIEFQGELYIGGNINTGFGGLHELVKWDGNNWVNPGINFLGGFAYISDLKIYNNELYVAGCFRVSDGNLSNHIVRFDGLSWKDVGGGMLEFSNGNDAIYKIETNQGYLYAVGAFDGAGGITSKYLARWDGNNWCGFGTNFDQPNFDIEFFDNELYLVCGKTINTDTVNYIAKWIGGNYVDTCGHINVGIDEIKNEVRITIYPNPTSAQFTITTNQQIQNIKIFNIIGETIQPTSSASLSKSTASIDLSNQPSGLYFVHIETDKTFFNQKIIKQ